MRYTGSIKLSDCLDKFIETERMMDCGYKCTGCKKAVSVEKDLTIFRFPRILVIHMKRFYHSAMRKEKLNTTVNFPAELDLKKFAPHSSKSCPLTCRPQQQGEGDLQFVRHFAPQRQSVRRPLHRGGVQPR